MPWFQRLNQATGAYEEVNDETGEVRPMAPQAVQAAAAPTSVAGGPSGFVTPQGNERIPGDVLGVTGAVRDFGQSLARGFQQLGQGIAGIGGAQPQVQTAPVEAPDTPMPNGGPGAAIGAMVGQYQPLEFNEPDLFPEDQQAIETLSSIQTGMEGSTPTLPTRTYTPDPGLAALVDIARQRDERLSPIIERLIAQVEGRQSEHAGRSNMRQFGEWLGRLAASRDLSQGGTILQDMRSRTDDLENQWSAEILRLTEMGYSLDEAVARAQAGVASGEHQARERTSEAGYEQAVTERQLTDPDRRASTQLAIALAQLQQEAGNRAREAQEAGLGTVAQIPGFETPAYTELGRRTFPDNERLAGVFGSGLASEQRLRNLAARVAGPYGDRQNLRELARSLRRLQPGITDQEINRVAQILSSAPAE